MAGESVPVVMVPRYTTYCGATDFLTIAIDASRYSAVNLTAWRGPMVGTSPAMTATAQESTDGFVWSTCDGANAQKALTSDNTEYSVVAPISKRYFRLKLTLGGTDPIGTCWVTGAFELRVA